MARASRTIALWLGAPVRECIGHGAVVAGEKNETVTKIEEGLAERII